MPITVKLTASQVRPGAPIQAAGSHISDLATDTPTRNVGYGVTLTPARPTTYGDFAAAADSFIPGTSLGYRSETMVASGPQNGAGDERYRDAISWRFSLPLDSNYAAGRYLWWWGAVGSTVDSDLALNYVSGPFRIR